MPPPVLARCRGRCSPVLRGVLVAVVLVLAASAPVLADGYLSALDDVPLMPGLTEVPDAGIDFEAATGRIVEAEATGALRPGFDRHAVLAFYAASLPALGWHASAPARFVRAGEVLEITVRTAKGRLTVHFKLHPR